MIRSLILFFLSLLFIKATFSQVASVISGGVSSGSGGTMSYSVGQVSYSSSTNAFGSLSEGVQQVTGISNVQRPLTPDRIYGYSTSKLAIIDVTDSFISGKTIRYSIKKVKNATFYRWSFSGYANNSEIISNDTFFTIRFPVGITSGILSVKASNDFFTSTPRTLNIKISAPPSPGTIYGYNANKLALLDITDSITNSKTVRYCVKQVKGANKYLWAVTGDASIIGPSLSSDTFVNVLFGRRFTTGTIKVWAVRSGSLTNVTSASFKSIIPKITLPTSPTTIFGYNALCPAVLDVTDSIANGQPVTFSVKKVSLANQYGWKKTGDANFTTNPITSDTTVKILFNPGFSSGSISVQSLRSGTDTSFGSTFKTITATKILPALPSIIQKASPGLIYDSIAAGKTVTFRLSSKTPKASSYEWSLASVTSGAAAVGVWIVGQPTDTTVTLRFATSEPYFTGCTLRARSIRGGSVAKFYSASYRTLTIAPGITPMPAKIFASSNPAPGAIITYFVDSVEKTSYTWTLPSVVTVIGSRTGPTIKVQYKSTYVVGTPVSFSVRAKSVYGLISPARTDVFNSLTARLNQLGNHINSSLTNNAVENNKDIVYPNPNRGKFHVKIQTGISQIYKVAVRIIDSKGSIVAVYDAINRDNTIEFDVSENKLNAGTYQLVWEMRTIGIRGSSQFIIEQ